MQDKYSLSLHDMVSSSPVYSLGPRAGATTLSNEASDLSTSSVLYRQQADVGQALSQLSHSVGLLQESLKTNNSLLRDISEMMQLRNGGQPAQSSGCDMQRLEDLLHQNKGEIRNDIKLLLQSQMPVAPNADAISSPRCPRDLQGIVPLLEEQLKEIKDVKNSLSKSEASGLSHARTRPSITIDENETERTTNTGKTAQHTSALSSYEQNYVHIETDQVHMHRSEAPKDIHADPLGMEAHKQKLRRHMTTQKLLNRRGNAVNHIRELFMNIFLRIGLQLPNKQTQSSPELYGEPDCEPSRVKNLKELPKVLRCLEWIVASNAFGTCSGILIVANAIWIGWVCNYQITRYKDQHATQSEDWFTEIDTIFAIVFLVEILFRMIALRMLFWCGIGWKFNVFDVVVVATSIVALFSEESGANISVLRLVRLLRILRMLRVFRELPFFEEMRHMLVVLIDSLKLLIWCILFVFFANYIGAIAIIEALLSKADGIDDFRVMGVVNSYYGSLVDGMLTLFYVVTGGISWGTMENELGDVSFLVRFFLNAYVMLFFFCVLPIINGMFTSRVLHALKNDTFVNMHHRNMEGNTFIAELKDACYKAGYRSRTGYLEEEDINTILQHPDIAWFLDVHKVELSPKEALVLFDTEDRTSSYITLHEFLYGCQWLKLQGKYSDMLFLGEKISAQSGQMQHVFEVMRSIDRGVASVQRWSDEEKAERARLSRKAHCPPSPTRAHNASSKAQ